MLVCILGLLLLTGSALAEGVTAQEPAADKKISKIAVQQEPTKTAYISGETFSLEGGTILVTYDDGTTDILPMTASCIEVKEPGLSSPGRKTVTLKLNKKQTRFSVNVANKAFAVSFELNYQGAPAAQRVEVIKGQAVEAMTPVREGYTFLGWYADQDYTALFDFETEIVADVTLYALWIRQDAEQVQVTFDMDYYGVKRAKYGYPVAKGETVACPAAVPVRTGYTFAGWVDVNGHPFDFSQSVQENVTVKATWKKELTGKQTWIFEAEDTDLTGKTGPAISGTANEVGMILTHPELNCSNDRSVGYLYKIGNSLEFYIAADADMDDAVIWLSLSAEMEALTIDPDTFGVYLNDEKLLYDRISITDVPAYDPSTYIAGSAPYQYYLMAENVHLNQGANIIKVITENSEAYPGTTMLAHAPLVDAVKIETEAVLIWDATHNLPMTSNYTNP